MSWKERLRRASFRGVAFHIRENSGELGGRRAAVHEYPGREEPYVEDLGRKLREFSVTAYVVGENYAAQRDRLVDACTKPGSGALVHPSLGTLTVVCTGCSVSERQDAGRMASVSLSFVDAGGNTFPAGTPDTSATVVDVADLYAKAAQTSFLQRYTTAGLPGWATDELGKATGHVWQAAGLTGVVAWDHLKGWGLASGIADAVRGLDFSAATSFAKTCGEYASYPSQTAVGKRVTALTSDVMHFARRTGLAQAACGLAKSEFASRTEAVEAFKALDGLVDGELHAASKEREDTLFFGAQDIRSACARDVSVRAANLPELQQRVATTTEPALVSAYRHAGSAEQVLDLIRRNSVQHPGFVPGGTELEILREDVKW